MELELGLYVSVGDGGALNRNLFGHKGEIALETATINTEIISFSEQNFMPYAKVVDTLSELFCDALFEADGEEHFGELYIAEDQFREAMYLVNGLLDELESGDPLHGTLTRLMLEDAVPPDDGSAWWMVQAGRTVVDRLSAIMRLQFLVNGVLLEIRNGTAPDLAGKDAFFARAEFAQILSLGEKLTSQYRFRSPVEYYRFLMMRLIANAPNVALCECCGRYFIPKTRKKTLYCDRIIRGKQTCKDIAPALKHKKEAGKSAVIRAFDQARQRMYQRYERELNAEHHLPKGISYSDYYEWCEAAAAARDACLKGELSLEEALEIIDA